MPNDLARSSAIVASLLALLPQRSPSSFRAALAPGGTRSSDPLRALTTPLFPYPESVKLLDVIDGAIVPPRTPEHPPFDLQGERAVGFPASAKLMDEVVAAGKKVHALALEMRELAVEACNAALRPEQRAHLDERYQADVARLTELVGASVFQGIPLMDGSRDVRLVVPPSRTRTKVVDLPDWRASSLGLDLPLATLMDAQAALDQIDVAIDSVEQDEARLALARRELLEGDPDGGLREIERLLTRMRSLAEQASDGTLNSGDRTILDRYRRSDLARLEDVSALEFDGLFVLEPGRVVLQGALGTSFPFDLPAASPDGLGLPGPHEGITTMTGAAETLEKLDHALVEVQAERTRVAATRDALVNGFLRLR